MTSLNSPARFIAAILFFGAALTASAVIMDERAHPVLLNGKPFANAITLNGVLAIPVQEFAKAVGVKVSLEPHLQLRGSTLSAQVWKTAPPNSAAQASDIFAKIGDIKGESLDSNRVADIQRPGVISNKVMMHKGKAYLPLADVARAFGVAGWQGPITMSAGQAISLNFTKNPQGTLIPR